MGLFSSPDDIEVRAEFPASNPLGLVVNGEQNKFLLSFVNSGSENYTISSASASYHDPLRSWGLLRNASTLKYDIPLPAGSNFSVPFKVFSEFKPEELGLTIWANLKDLSGDNHRYIAMNGTVTVVEQQGSWFDPGLIFLYLILGAIFSLLGLLALNALSAKYFPNLNIPFIKRNRKVDALQISTRKMLVPNPLAGKGYPETAQPYEEEWIPEHLRKGSKASLRSRKNQKGVAGAVEESATSGGETSGGDKKKSGKGKSKSKK